MKRRNAFSLLYSVMKSDFFMGLEGDILGEFFADLNISGKAIQPVTENHSAMCGLCVLTFGKSAILSGLCF